MSKMSGNAFALSAEAVSRFAEHGLALQIVEETGSTNDDLKAVLRAGAVSTASTKVLVARRQTAGRGTRGHRWQSITDAMIFSLAFSQVPVDSTVSLRVGIAVAQTFRALLGIGLALKWPNDLWYQEAKVGGILSEMVQEPQGTMGLVVGIGINLCVPERLQLEKWALDGLVDDRNFLLNVNWDTVFLSLCEAISSAVKQPTFSFVEEWPYYDAFRDARLELELPSGRITGYNRGISASGCLLVETEQAILDVSNGSILKKL